MFDSLRKEWIKFRLGRSGKYLDVGRSRIYYETYGEGEPLFMFHGGSSTLEAFRCQIPELSKYFRIILPERPGNGHTADIDGPYSYKNMADDMVSFAHALDIQRAPFVGYSDGANLLLFIALEHPFLVEKFVSIGGNFHHSGCNPDFQNEMRNLPRDSVGEEIDEKYAKYSPDGPDHYAEVFYKTRQLWLTQPTFKKQDIEKIQTPALILCGDHDVIERQHTLDFFEALPNAYLSIVPGTTHRLIKEKPAIVNRILLDFLQNPYTSLSATDWS